MRKNSPQPDSIPKDFYQVKKLVSKIGLKEEKIDYCLKWCMLYYKDDDALTPCKIYEEPRFKLKWKMGSIRMFFRKECTICP